MLDHVSARCARYRLLFPSRNIESITPLPVPARPLLGARSALEGGSAVAVDLRTLLGEVPEGSGGGIKLEWVSTNQEHRATLLVDAVEEIISSSHGQLAPLPQTPRRVQTLCEGVLAASDGTFRLGLRLDALWPTTLFCDRRLWRKALVSLPPEVEASKTHVPPVVS
jgi:chemotaxis signal transduction protein